MSKNINKDICFGYGEAVSKKKWEEELGKGKIGVQSGRNDALYYVRENILYRVSFSGSIDATLFERLGVNAGVQFYILDELQVTLLGYIEKKLKEAV